MGLYPEAYVTLHRMSTHEHLHKDLWPRTKMLRPLTYTMYAQHHLIHCDLFNDI